MIRHTHICEQPHTFRDENECRHCPQKNDLSTWRQKEDVEFRVTCDEVSAMVNFDMEKMQTVGWMNNVILQLKIYNGGPSGTLQPNPTIITDMKKIDLKVDITLADTVCLEITRGSSQTKEFCEVGLVF